MRYYRLLLWVAASISLTLAGCGDGRPAETAADPATGAMPTTPLPVKNADSVDTEATIWTVLGLGKEPSQLQVGPQTGNTVSPVLWEAAHNALDFAGISSEDPVTGLLVTKWYSPTGKPDERLRINAYVLSRALRSDSLSVTIERQVRSPTGQWTNTPIARDTVLGLENAILQRARQIHAERYRSTM